MIQRLANLEGTGSEVSDIEFEDVEQVLVQPGEFASGEEEIPVPARTKRGTAACAAGCISKKQKRIVIQTR